MSRHSGSAFLRRAATAAGLSLGLAVGGAAAQSDAAQSAAPAAQGTDLGADPEADSEAYRLVIGDTVSMAILGEGEGWEAQVDLDGGLRLPGFGRVHVEGKTLDQAEAFMLDEIEKTGLYVSPRLSLGIASYAPVVVTGAVRDPGAFDYRPNLTAEAASGLAGGVAMSEIDGNQTALASVQLVGDLRRLGTDILHTTIRIARVEAQLEGRETFEFDPAEMPVVAPDPDLLAHLVLREQAILDEEISGDRQLIALRTTELEETDNQIDLLLRRREVQEDMILLQQEEREAAESLDARGLRTRMDMARIERSEAEVQARLLDIDAALSQARTRRADISRALTQFRIDRRVDLLEASARERADLEQLLHQRRTALEKSALIGNPAAGFMPEEAGLVIDYTVRRRTDGTMRSFSVEPDFMLRPGDILNVRIRLNPIASPSEESSEGPSDGRALN